MLLTLPLRNPHPIGPYCASTPTATAAAEQVKGAGVQGQVP